MSLFFENDFSNPDIFWYIGYIYVIAYYYNILVNYYASDNILILLSLINIGT